MASKDADTDNGLIRVAPSWPADGEGDHPVTEFTSDRAGALSPFGDDIKFPLPVSLLRYEHTTARPNR
ncbi:hypothetical protein CLV47_12178 [Antricoccus suffuscus]|uniref:Uncharacterized protein n=1 Tax=Antricoccus suffuscus TaxID=1629062 RepID=A0A2T0ZJX7_9ACTN|nr:hypothetical protein [Antricoccus suffuscus]PRZ36641.1 hypothetical protein CLV47_12178 [Antricoccus suffuscus]